MATTEDLSSDNVYLGKGKEDSIKWYAEWPQYEELLTSHLSFRSEEQLDSAGAQPPAEKEAAEVSILVPGRLYSKLSENLYDAGFKNITYLDFSEEFIRDMLKRNVGVRPEIKWRAMNISNMQQFANETFDAIVDKGVLDSLMVPIPSSLGRPYLNEVKRVLKSGGKFFCLTIAGSSIFSDLLLPMFRFGWKMILYPIGQKASLRRKLVVLQTFMLVAEKDSSLAVHAISSSVEEFNSNSARAISEVLLKENEIRSKYAKGANILYSLEDLRLGAIGNLSKLVPGRRVKLSIGRCEGVTYYSVLLDAKEVSKTYNPYAVLVIPQNRASEWINTCEEGQWTTVRSSKVSRLLMVLLDSSNSSLPSDYIEKDLTPLVKHLEPEGCGEEFEIPFLRAVDKTKKREFVYQVSSDTTGPIVVEDVIYQHNFLDDYKGCKFRHLIFKRTVNLVQSRALLSVKESNRVSTDFGKDKEQQASKPENEGKQTKSDSQSSSSPVSSGEVKVVHNHLVNQHHNGIVLGIQLISSYLKVSTSARGLVNTVVIGLGGGLLPMYMKNYFPFLKIEVVEIDHKVLHVAREYFGFSEDERLKVHISDGIKFVKEKADENSSCKVDILVVDIYSSDPSSALLRPPADFVDESFLWAVKDSLSEQGLYIINLITKSSAEKNAVYSRLKKVFSCILSLQQENMNEVLFALKTTAFPIKEDQLSGACNEFANSLELEKKWIEEEASLSKSIKLLN